MSELTELVISFDTTGSMYPCLADVRRGVDNTAKRMFAAIPNLRIGIVAHGDYCDERSTYVTKHLALTNDPNAVSYFVKNVERTGGGDAPECYELVLHEVSKIKWTEGSKRILLMIGDDVPHPPAHNPERLDWRTELDNLAKLGVLVHGVQALNRHHATSFYAEMARKSGGFHLNLNQLNEATDMLLAVSYQQASPEALQTFEEEVVTNRRMTRSLSDIFNKLSRRDPTTGRFRRIDARATREGRFQKIIVDRDTPIKDLVEENGLLFQRGRGFYEFTKRETIQKSKEVIILDKETGDMFEGEAARDILGLPHDSNIDISPKNASFDPAKYAVFVQSTSNNRKLIGGTTFLYEAE